MQKTVTFEDFREAFENIRPDNFTYRGLKTLYEYLTDFETDTGESLELDVIAFCCEFSEYSDIEHAWDAYGIEGENGTDEEREDFRSDYVVAEADDGTVIVREC